MDFTPISPMSADVIKYSIIITFIIDFFSRIAPKFVTDWTKQLIATVIGIIYCVIFDITVFDNSTIGHCFTGILWRPLLDLVSLR
jgi:hypothetical protein